MANSDEVNKKSKVSVLCIYQYYAHVMHSLIKELYINLKNIYIFLDNIIKLNNK